MAYESLKSFEEELNTRLKTGNLKVHVVMMPMSRDQLAPALATGKVDMVAAMVTVTPEREKLVAFSIPTRTGVNQVVVTGPGAPTIATLDDLSGQEVFVRKGSIYDESIVELNKQLQARGKPPVVVAAAPDVLEDDDVLEMVNAGPRADHRRRRLPRRLLAQGVHRPHGALRRHPADRRRAGGGVSQGQPETARRGQPLDREAWQGRRLPQRARAPLPGQRQVREERGRGVGAEEAAGRRADLSRSTASSTTSTTC